MSIISAVTNRENELLYSIAGGFPRHPGQLNELLEADAEIIKIRSSPEEYLIIKTDGIQEEITSKLYEDPWLIGWMTITAPISDLAAVGVQPLGLLLSLVLPGYYNNQWLQDFNAGAKAACEVYNTYILGGDTNFDDRFSASATAVGMTNSQPLTRKTIKAGDNIYSSGLMGQGNSYAYTKFFHTNLHVKYQPVARLKESGMINRYASACIDSSDGFFPALSVLAEINNIGFDISAPLVSLLSTDALRISELEEIPSWMLLAGPHGDYELIFSIPDAKVSEFETACQNEGWQPLYLGRAKKEKEFHFISESLAIRCSPALIPNMYFEAAGDIPSYFQQLLKQHTTWSTLNA